MKIPRKALVASILFVGLAMTGAVVKAKADPAPPSNFLTVAAGSHIKFLNGTPLDPGVITVDKGILEVQYFDGTWAYVGMGKYAVLQAYVLETADVYVNQSKNIINIEGGTTVESGTWHTHWSEWSKWVD